MIVRIDDVLDRLIGDALHLVYDALMVLIEFIVNQDHALVRDVDSDIPAVAFNLVQVVFHLVQRELSRAPADSGYNRSRPAREKALQRRSVQLVSGSCAATISNSMELEVFLEQIEDPLVLVGPARRFHKSVVLHWINRQLPILFAQFDQALH